MIGDIENILERLKCLSSFNLKKVLVKLEAKIKNDIKSERKAKQSYERNLTLTQKKIDNLLDMKLEGSITYNQYANKLDQLKQNERFFMESIKEYSHVVSSQVDGVNILINLISYTKELFNVSKNDKKREILKILFSKQEFDKKMQCFQ